MAQAQNEEPESRQRHAAEAEAAPEVSFGRY
jgi:hypothetical protein